MANIDEPVDPVYALDRAEHYLKVAHAYHHNWVSIPTTILTALVDGLEVLLNGPEEITPGEG